MKKLLQRWHQFQSRFAALVATMQAFGLAHLHETSDTPKQLPEACDALITELSRVEHLRRMWAAKLSQPVHTEQEQAHQPVDIPFEFVSELPYNLQPLLGLLKTVSANLLENSSAPVREVDIGAELRLLVEHQDESAGWYTGVVLEIKQRSNKGRVKRVKHLLKLDDGSQYWAKLSTQPHYFQS
jgi:hypothetical protein